MVLTRPAAGAPGGGTVADHGAGGSFRKLTLQAWSRRGGAPSRAATPPPPTASCTRGVPLSVPTFITIAAGTNASSTSAAARTPTRTERRARSAPATTRTIPSPQARAANRRPSGSRVSSGPARGAKAETALVAAGQRAAVASAQVVAKTSPSAISTPVASRARPPTRQSRASAGSPGHGGGQEHRGQDQVVRMHDAREVEGEQQRGAAGDERVHRPASPELLAQQPEAGGISSR